MSTLYITEYARYARTLDGYNTSAPEEPPLAQQTIAISGASVQSAVLSANTRLVRMSADATCSIEVGTNPTATAASRRIPANQVPEYLGIPNTGGTFKLAAITNV